MTIRATQVYLTEEQHTALQEAARREGRSMTEVVRRLVDEAFLREKQPPTDLRSLAGIVRLGHPTDVATDRDRLLADALRAVR